MEQQQGLVETPTEPPVRSSPPESNISLLIVGVVLIILVGIGSYIFGVKSQQLKLTSSSPTPTLVSLNPAPDKTNPITISNSGSTNTPGRDLVIWSDGSGKLTYTSHARQTGKDYSPKEYPPQTFLDIVNDVQTIDDVSTIHTANDCSKSASFGSSTIILYKGNVSKDIQCMQKNPPALEHHLIDEINKHF